MKNNFKLALVAEIGNKENPIKSHDWSFFMNFFKEKGEVILFDWKSLKKDFMVSRYIKENDNTLEIIEKETDIRDLCDIIYIGQLGQIHQNKEPFMKFLDILESFPGEVINPIKTIKKNLSKQYLIDLQKKGIKVIPTINIDSNMSISELENLEFPNYGKAKDGIVLKPKVFGEQGDGVVKLEDFSSEEELQEYFLKSSGIIAQPLIKDIYIKGENSFIFLGRKYSHGVNKITGEFKINFKSDSTNKTKYIPTTPTEKELKLCNDAFNVLGIKYGYLRIDIIPGENPLIGEIEMINPAGYLKEVGAFHTYSENLNKRLNEIFNAGKNQWM